MPRFPLRIVSGSDTVPLGFILTKEAEMSKRANGEDKAKAVELYCSGLSSIKVADHLGVSKSFVLKAINESGIAKRSRLVKTSDEVAASICEKYSAGTSVNDLIQEFGLGQHVIRRIIDQGGKRREKGYIGNLLLANRDSIVSRYESGETAKSIGESFGCGRLMVSNCLKSVGVEIRSPSVANRKYAINHEAFSGIPDELNEAQRYWIGFIMADGSICDTAKYTKYLSVVLSDSEFGHLGKLKEFLGYGGPILFYENRGFGDGHKNCSLKVASKTICDSLANNGVNPRKTFNAAVPDHLKKCRHFWRGMIDGDGCLGRGKRQAFVSLCGSSFDIVDGFRTFCQSLCDTKSKVQKSNSGTYKYTKDHFRFYLASNNARKVISELYKDANHFLDRKMESAKSIKGIFL